ncbi:MAG: HAMP domain-containing sensor histidine kinase [Elusimicrobiales bacterium]|nr:HAMP domain-containing sensor histidine kinase [Elusimicrobiales bacterium]
MNTGQAYTGNFARGGYELLFLVFMLGIAFLLRGNPLIVYPDILYLFLMLTGGNLLFNLLAPRLRGGEAWVVELALLLNMLLATDIIKASGGGESYFWVLYLLPVFTAALAVKLFDVVSALLFCCLAVVYFSKPLQSWDVAEGFSVAVKLAILVFSAAVLYRTASSRQQSEEVLAAKKAEAERLLAELEEKRECMVAGASANEVGTLISGVLHDLGSPLSVIMIGAEILAAEEAYDKDSVQRMARAARHAIEMVGNAMGIVKGREYVFAKDSFPEAARGAMLLADFLARKKKVRILAEISKDIPQAVISRVHIQRVLTNLLNNAVSYSPEGGAVSLLAGYEGGRITGRVQDSGPGFPENILRSGVKAFSTTRKGEGGTGLGLFVAREILRKHGGRLLLSNAPGGGGRVNFEIPVSGPQ